MSSAFTVWQDTGEGVKGRFVVNLSKQSKKWKKGSVRMESVSEFATSIQKGDHLLSMDIEKGYRHFRLHPAMRDWFIFHYYGKYYRCIALPFGWGRSPLWFTQLMTVFLRPLRQLGYRVLCYLDDFLIAPSPYGQVASLTHCAVAKEKIEALLQSLGLRRHPTKGEWNGSQVVEHLGIVINTKEMTFSVDPRKAEKVRRLAGKLLKEVRFGKRWVTSQRLRSFCGVCVSLTLAMPWARFYTRALYWDLGSNRPRDNRGRCRLSHQSIKDLRFWKGLAEHDLGGRPMTQPVPQAAMHTDAADMGFGGTLNTDDLRQGVPGMWCSQGVWSWKDRAKSISLRELKAIRKLLLGRLGQRIAASSVTDLLLHVDNQPVTHIVNSLVSASRPMMRELRRLKAVLDRLGIRVKAEWIPSVANKFADALSRRFPRGDLQIRRQLRRSIADGMKAPVDVFKFRPLGEHPSYLRRAFMDELQKEWDRETVRLLCPPVDLIGATVRKLALTKAPALLLIPDWPRQPWHQAAIHLATRVERLEQPPTEVWAAQRKLNPQWRLLQLEINLA